ncbi:tRNA (guanosine(37)-N1)-methyltransferase TrmD, partial [Patescibacteria group bacterium]|nr:tRNA (guanosine(37)-N1)-methyltransferase TrmD [Patescibacteria group bacterium]MBU1685209.1 tRNA (guanosine(37)-N1)-methyltransferase TrmD [Patescibacteria group bacterium]MBU1938873.1 tRNA (guanosine(37)-N1)-methyltransferase TrmD [Patescibacteria group bacterium]
MQFHVLTIFPEMFQGFLNESILKKAQGNGHIQIVLHDIRQYSKDKHMKVDDTPYGGGAGMVFTPQPLFDCIEAVKELVPEAPVIYLSPKGRKLTQARAERLAHKPACRLPAGRQGKAGFTQFILICGHYEGIDQRVIDALVDFELSIGDYVLSGGELPAMVFIDVMSRLVPGVLGNEESHQEETFSKRLDRKKEYPHY